VKSEKSPSRTHARQACTREEFQPPYRPRGNGRNGRNVATRSRVRVCARAVREDALTFGHYERLAGQRWCRRDHRLGGLLAAARALQWLVAGGRRVRCGWCGGRRGVRGGLSLGRLSFWPACCGNRNAEAPSSTGAAVLGWAAAADGAVPGWSWRSWPHTASVCGGSALICRSRAGRDLGAGDRPHNARHAQPRADRGTAWRSPATRPA
jgi:hypothetical protein